MDVKEIISSGLLELYVAGLASKEEAMQVEQSVRQYPEVASEMASIESAIETYAVGQSIETEPAVKQKIFSRINSVNIGAAPSQDAFVVSKAYGIPSYWKWVAAASVILLMGSIVLNVMFYNKYSVADINRKKSEEKYNEANKQLAELTDSNKEMKEDMNVVQSKYSEPIALHGMPAAPDAVAKVFWMKNTTGEVYIDPSNLPDVAQGKQYQLWAIVDGKPVDAGMILTTKKGDKYRIQKMKSFGKADAFAITLEKEGGSPTPTMDQMIVMGKL